MLSAAKRTMQRCERVLEREGKPTASESDTRRHCSVRVRESDIWRLRTPDLRKGCLRNERTPELLKGGLHTAHTHFALPLWHSLHVCVATALDWSAFVCVSIWNWSSSRRLRKVTSSAAHAERSSAGQRKLYHSLTPLHAVGCVSASFGDFSLNANVCAALFDGGSDVGDAVSAAGGCVRLRQRIENVCVLVVCRCKTDDYVSLLFPHTHTQTHKSKCSAPICNQFDSNHKGTQTFAALSWFWNSKSGLFISERILKAFWHKWVLEYSIHVRCCRDIFFCEFR